MKIIGFISFQRFNINVITKIDYVWAYITNDRKERDLRWAAKKVRTSINPNTFWRFVRLSQKINIKRKRTRNVGSIVD